MQDLVATTRYGKVRGVREGDIRVWRGVRYARAPRGELRFRAPQPLEAWAGIKDATRFGPASPQAELKIPGLFGFPSESVGEDCLSLNIYAPAADGKKRPVMFWIHGGAFLLGSGAPYKGGGFVRNGGVVVVTINYRLGPLGFLALKDVSSRAEAFDTNVGLRDQIAALRWVKENIAEFGGDPEQVTVFGESAGGSSITCLLGIPSASGLFQRAIVESAPPDLLYDHETAAAAARRYLSFVGVSPNNLAPLLTMPLKNLIGAVRRFSNDIYKTLPGNMAFQPVIGDDLMPRHPFTALAEGSAKDIPLVIGSNHDETALFIASTPPIVPITPMLVHHLFEKSGRGKEEGVVAAYPGYPQKKALISLTTDLMYRIPAIRIAEAQSAYAPTWMYRFDWSSWSLRASGFGACHALELLFVFDAFSSPVGRLATALPHRRQMRALAQRMQRAWLNVAVTGDPNGGSGASWAPYDAQTRATMLFDVKDGVVHDPESHQRKAWDGVDMGQAMTDDLNLTPTLTMDMGPAA